MSDSRHDEEALRKLVERYFHALDERDMDAIGECFTSDAQASFNGSGAVLEGRDTILRAFTYISTFPLSTHVLGNTWIDLEKSTGVVHAVAYLKASDGGGGGRMLVRGLRYDDQYCKEGGQWRFRHRSHRALWQYAADFVDPWLPAKN